MFFIPDWVKAIWEVFSNLGKLIWTILTNCWGVILGVTSVLMMLWDGLKSLFTVVSTQLSAIWTIITGASGTAHTLMSAGWPAWLADSFALVNTVIPLAELLAFFGTMVSTYIVMGLLRMLKSVLPTVAT